MKQLKRRRQGSGIFGAIAKAGKYAVQLAIRAAKTAARLAAKLAKLGAKAAKMAAKAKAWVK